MRHTEPFRPSSRGIEAHTLACDSVGHRQTGTILAYAAARFGVDGMGEAELEGQLVILAERDRDLRQVIPELLEGLGARVTSTANVDDAILAMRSQRFDALVIDSTLWFARNGQLAQAALLLQSESAMVVTGFLEPGQSLPPGSRLLPKPYSSDQMREALALTMALLRRHPR